MKIPDDVDVIEGYDVLLARDDIVSGCGAPESTHLKDRCPPMA